MLRPYHQYCIINNVNVIPFTGSMSSYHSC